MVSDIKIAKTKRLLGSLIKGDDGDYEGHLTPKNGAKIPYILILEDLQIDQVVFNISNLVEKIQLDLDGFKKAAASDVLEYFNVYIGPDMGLPRLSAEELAEKLEVSGMTFYHNGDATLYYDNDDLFPGHSVQQTLSEDGSKRYDADFVG